MEDRDVEMVRITPTVKIEGEEWKLVLAQGPKTREIVPGTWWKFYLDGVYAETWRHLVQHHSTGELKWVIDGKCWFDDPPRPRTWAELPEELTDGVIECLRDDYAVADSPVSEAVPRWKESRRLYGQAIQDHFGEGMAVRNWLRQYASDERIGGNWDDYYLDCIHDFLDRIEKK